MQLLLGERVAAHDAVQRRHLLVGEVVLDSLLVELVALLLLAVDYVRNVFDA